MNSEYIDFKIMIYESKFKHSVDFQKESKRILDIRSGIII